MKQFRIGRNDDNDIVINDSSVSRYHATLVHTDEKYILEDNNSSNGTFVNGNRITQEIHLKQNDIVKLGTVLFPWMTYVGLKENGPLKTVVNIPSEKSTTKDEKQIKEETAKKSNEPRMVLPEPPKSLGNSIVKKTFGTLFLLIGLALIVLGVAVATEGSSDAAIAGLGGLIIGLIFLIIGIVRVSTKSRSQVRKEAELLAHSKYQAAILNAHNAEQLDSDGVIQKLEKLNQLKKQGVLSKAEFEREKKKIIG